MAFTGNDAASCFLTAGGKHVRCWQFGPASIRMRGGGGGNAADVKPVPMGALKDATLVAAARDPAAGDGSPADVYGVTSDGTLCLLRTGKGGLSLEKWVELKARKAHALDVTLPVAWSPPGTLGLVACACSEGIVRLFSTRSLAYRLTLPKPPHCNPSLDNGAHLTGQAGAAIPAAVACRFCGDARERQLAVVYADHTLVLWDMSDVLGGHEGAATGDAASKGAVNVRAVRRSRTLPAHAGCIWDVVALPSLWQGAAAGGQGGGGGGPLPPGCVATCSADGSIRVWNLRPHHGTHAHASTPSQLAGAHGNVANPSEGRGALWWQDAEGGAEGPLDGHMGENPISDMSVAGSSTAVRPTRDLVAVLLAQEGRDSAHEAAETSAPELRCLCVSMDGRHLACGDKAGNVRVFDLSTLALVTLQAAHDAEVLSLAYSAPVGPWATQKILQRGAGGPMFGPLSGLWSMDTGTPLLASGGRDRLVHLFNVAKAYELAETLDGHSGTVTCVRFADNGNRLLSCGADKSVLFRHVAGVGLGESSAIYHHAVVPRGTLYGMDVDVTGKFAVTAGQDKRLNVWSVESGRPVRSYKVETELGEPIQVRLDPSGSFMACSHSDKSLRLHDFYTGELLSRVAGHGEVVTGIAFSQDCRHLYSVSGDGCMFVWRLPDARVKAMHARLASLCLQRPDDPGVAAAALAAAAYSMPRNVAAPSSLAAGAATARALEASKKLNTSGTDASGPVDARKQQREKLQMLVDNTSADVEEYRRNATAAKRGSASSGAAGETSGPATSVAPAAAPSAVGVGGATPDVADAASAAARAKGWVATPILGAVKGASSAANPSSVHTRGGGEDSSAAEVAGDSVAETPKGGGGAGDTGSVLSGSIPQLLFSLRKLPKWARARALVKAQEEVKPETQPDSIRDEAGGSIVADANVSRGGGGVAAPRDGHSLWAQRLGPEGYSYVTEEGTLVVAEEGLRGADASGIGGESDRGTRRRLTAESPALTARPRTYGAGMSPGVSSPGQGRAAPNDRDVSLTSLAERRRLSTGGSTLASGTSAPATGLPVMKQDWSGRGGDAVPAGQQEGGNVTGDSGGSAARPGDEPGGFVRSIVSALVEGYSDSEGSGSERDEDEGRDEPSVDYGQGGAGWDPVPDDDIVFYGSEDEGGGGGAGAQKGGKFAVSMSVQRGEGFVMAESNEEGQGGGDEAKEGGSGGSGGRSEATKGTSSGRDDGSPSTGEEERDEEGCEMASPRLDLFAAHYDKLGDLNQALVVPVGSSARLSCSSLFFAKAIKESRDAGLLPSAAIGAAATLTGSKAGGAGAGVPKTPSNPAGPKPQEHPSMGAHMEPPLFTTPQGVGALLSSAMPEGLAVPAAAPAVAVAASIPAKRDNVPGAGGSLSLRSTVELLDDEDEDEGGGGLNHSLQAERERLKLKERQGRMAQEVAEMRQRLAGLGVAVAHHTMNNRNNSKSTEAQRPLSPVAAVSLAAAMTGTLGGLLPPKAPPPQTDAPVLRGDVRNDDDDDDVMLRGEDAGPGSIRFGSTGGGSPIPTGMTAGSRPAAASSGATAGVPPGTLLGGGRQPPKKAGGVGVMLDDDGEDFTRDSVNAGSVSGSTVWFATPWSGRARALGDAAGEAQGAVGPTKVTVAADTSSRGTAAAESDGGVASISPASAATSGLPSVGAPSIHGVPTTIPAGQVDDDVAHPSAPPPTMKPEVVVMPRPALATQPSTLSGDEVSIVAGVGGGAWADGDSVLASLSGALRAGPENRADGHVMDGRSGMDGDGPLAEDTASDVDSDSDITFDAVTPDKAHPGREGGEEVPGGGLSGTATVADVTVVVSADNARAASELSPVTKGLTGAPGRAGRGIVSLKVTSDSAPPPWQTYEAVLEKLSAVTSDACAVLAQLEGLAAAQMGRKDGGDTSSKQDSSAGTAVDTVPGCEGAARENGGAGVAAGANAIMSLGAGGSAGAGVATGAADVAAARALARMRDRMAAISGQLAQALRLPAEEPLPEGDLCYEDDSMGGRRLSQMLHGQRLSDIGLGSRVRSDVPPAYEEMLAQYSKQVVAEVAGLLERQAQQQSLQLEQLLRHHKGV
eukprot:jgi/Mesvir1/3250/Mv16390-RA.2